MDEFAKYRELWQQGVTPVHIYSAGKADGLDEIALIRLVRTVCALSLGDVKKVIGVADVCERRQEVTVGATVCWDESTGPGVDWFDVVEARVLATNADRVDVEPTKRTRVTRQQVEVMPVDHTPRTMRRDAFTRTICERLPDLLRLASRWEKDHCLDAVRATRS